jgi:hypothetical protein
VRIPKRFVISEDGSIVNDLRTGLSWQREVDKRCFTLAAAKEYAEQICIGGLSGWRLPTIEELLSIADYGKYNPAIDTIAFPEVSAEMGMRYASDRFRFWSSTAYAPNSAFVWSVYFIDGNLDSYDTASSARVRCVRRSERTRGSKRLVAQ